MDNSSWGHKESATTEQLSCSGTIIGSGGIKIIMTLVLGAYIQRRRQKITKKKKKKPLILEMLKESVHRANENTEADVINHTQEGQG